MVKNLPAMQETWVRSLDWEDPPEQETATHSSILTWRIPWTEDVGRLQFMGSQRVRHALVAHTHTHTHTHTLEGMILLGAQCISASIFDIIYTTYA